MGFALFLAELVIVFMGIGIAYGLCTFSIWLVEKLSALWEKIWQNTRF